MNKNYRRSDCHGEPTPSGLTIFPKRANSIWWLVRGPSKQVRHASAVHPWGGGWREEAFAMPVGGHQHRSYPIMMFIIVCNNRSVQQHTLYSLKARLFHGALTELVYFRCRNIAAGEP